MKSRLLLALALLLVGFAACRPGPTNFPIPDIEVFYPHIENVSVPEEVRVGQPAEILVSVSMQAAPGVLHDEDMHWANQYISRPFEQGVVDGTYETGEFIGLYVRPEPSAGPPGTVVTVTETFETAGIHYLHFGHVADESQGGYQRRMNALDSESYPFEDMPPFEYLKVAVNVVP